MAHPYSQPHGQQQQAQQYFYPPHAYTQAQVQGMPTPSPSVVPSRGATPAAVGYVATPAAERPERPERPEKSERQGPGRPRRERQAVEGRERGQAFKGSFTKDLMHLMYAFGDVPNPAPDSVSVLEEIVIEYILDLCQTSLRATPHKTRLQVDDLRHALRHAADSKELGRLEELLFLHEEIKRARAEFAVEDGA